MQDAIDLNAAIINSSPDVRAWAMTRAITRVTEDPRGGFSFEFDQPLPDLWKWPSNPDVPSENFQFTVWAFVRAAGVWQGAGFVQMWKDRPMGTGALPAIFAVNDGVQGYVNWWGDPRHLWGAMSDYVPQPGDEIALMVSAGNGRLCAATDPSNGLSVPERSNIVAFTLVANDVADVHYGAEPPVPQPIPPQPEPIPPTPEPGPTPPAPCTCTELLMQIITLLTSQNERLDNTGSRLGSIESNLLELDARISTVQSQGSTLPNILKIATAIEQDLHGVKSVTGNARSTIATVAADLAPLVRLLGALKG